MGDGGFEPPKAKPADLQSVPFGHSGNLPYSIKLELVDGRSLFSKVCHACGIATAHFATKNIAPRYFLNAAHPLRLRVRLKTLVKLELVDGLEPPTC